MDTDEHGSKRKRSRNNQLNHKWTRKNTNGKPPENTRFVMSLKGDGADDVGFSAFPLMMGNDLNTEVTENRGNQSFGLRELCVL